MQNFGALGSSVFLPWKCEWEEEEGRRRRGGEKQRGEGEERRGKVKRQMRPRFTGINFLWDFLLMQLGLLEPIKLAGEWKASYIFSGLFSKLDT